MSDLENKPGAETDKEHGNQEPENNMEPKAEDRMKKPDTGEKADTIKEVLMGLGIPVLGVLLAVSLSMLRLKTTVLMICYLVILAVVSFICIKFFRTNHKTAAIIILTLLTPAILFFMLFGACFIMLSGLH